MKVTYKPCIKNSGYTCCLVTTRIPAYTNHINLYYLHSECNYNKVPLPVTWYDIIGAGAITIFRTIVSIYVSTHPFTEGCDPTQLYVTHPLRYTSHEVYSAGSGALHGDKGSSHSLL